MNGRSLCPRPTAGAWLHQSLDESAGHEPSLPLRITSRLAGIRGGPQGAVSDVGDPTERLTSLTALRRPTFTTLYGSAPDADTTQEVSPDLSDSSTAAASPPSRFRTAGRRPLNAWGPRPRLPRSGCGGTAGPADGRAGGLLPGPTRAAFPGASQAADGTAVGPHWGRSRAGFLGACTAGCCRAALGLGSWARARWRLVRATSSLML